MNFWRRLKRCLHVIKFTFDSLSYNASRPANHYLDSAFEPLFWFVDNFTGYLGVIFVILVTVLTSSVVLLWYMFLRPLVLTYSAPYIIFHFVFGHYLLLNIAFHYFQACFTSPGYPPNGVPMEDIQGAAICKYCIQPKPPRTHHCSICNKCYLKMDHHCPWMNNCIGFLNHRYFISFCSFMWIGTVYVSCTCYNLFIYHFQHPGTLSDAKANVFKGSVLESVMNQFNMNKTVVMDHIEQKEVYRPHPGNLEIVHEWEHIGIIYLFLLCGAVAVALGLLNIWHFILIFKGETSIEVHINNSEHRKAAKHGMGYNNPYDYGWKENLKILFALYNGRTILSVLFPSCHKPQGDGLVWPSNNKLVHYTNPVAFQQYNNPKYELLQKFLPC